MFCYRIPAPIGALGQNTSRIHNKEVETPFCFQAADYLQPSVRVTPPPLTLTLTLTLTLGDPNPDPDPDPIPICNRVYVYVYATFDPNPICNRVYATFDAQYCYFPYRVFIIEWRCLLIVMCVLPHKNW